MRRGIELRVENDLSDAGSVPEIDKNKAAMVPPRPDPPGENQFTSHRFSSGRAAIAAPFPIAQRVAESSFHRHQFDFLAINTASMFSKSTSSCSLVAIWRS